MLAGSFVGMEAEGGSHPWCIGLLQGNCGCRREGMVGGTLPRLQLSPGGGNLQVILQIEDNK